MMKWKTRGVLGAVLLAAGLSFSVGAYAAPVHDHEAHHHDAPASLQLNAGKKWETDAPLRQAMGNIRQALDGSLHAIHENRLSVAGYAALARKVDGEVAAIVSNCKLEPQADAQLHLIVAELLAGAERMAGKVKNAKRRDGAVKVVGALDNYAAYFDDAGFKPLAH